MENHFEEALNFVDAAVFAITGRHLKDVEVVIFRGEGQRQKYHEIASADGYSEKYLKQDIGHGFRLCLTFCASPTSFAKCILISNT